MNTPTLRVLLGLAAAAAVALPASAQDPYAQPDESWISIDGTVEMVRADGFTLDYGEGLITVEMDDGDRDADGYKLQNGEQVTVYGRIDDDFFEASTIEASSVYVENAGTYFYASPMDEEDLFVTVTTPVTSRLVLQGWVTEVGEEEFTLSTGMREVTVDIEEMAYDPLDDEGYQKIEVGDHVTVTGWIDAELFEGREIDALTVTELHTG